MIILWRGVISFCIFPHIYFVSLEKEKNNNIGMQFNEMVSIEPKKEGTGLFLGLRSESD